MPAGPHSHPAIDDADRPGDHHRLQRSQRHSAINHFSMTRCTLARVDWRPGRLRSSLARRVALHRRPGIWRSICACCSTAARGQRPIVSADGFRLLSTPYIEATEFSPTAFYGYGIAVDVLDGHKILRHTGGMNCFASSIHVDLDGGVAAFASINAMQGYRPTPVTQYAIQLLRAQREGKPLPAAEALTDAGRWTMPASMRACFAATTARSCSSRRMVEDCC